MFNPIEHSENILLRISKTMLELECYSRTLDKHAYCKNAKELEQNRPQWPKLCAFVPLAEGMFVKL